MINSRSMFLNTFNLSWAEVKSRKRLSSRLDIYEETIIYKYSVDGYEDLNELLRRTSGNRNSQFGRFLRASLQKLPNYIGLVYRAANLNKAELNRYQKHLRTGELLNEYSFVSSSRSRVIAMAFGANCLFRIWSKSGKSIEEYAKFGIANAQNELEVLFLNNCRFKVVDISNESEYTLITMFEV